MNDKVKDKVKHIARMKSKLDGRLDEILDLFADGETFRGVARIVGVSTRTLNKFLTRKDNVEQYYAVLQESSDSYASMAEEALRNSPADKIEIQRARELAHHYRWMAAKRNPKRYGDKLDVDAKVSGNIVIQMPSEADGLGE